MSCLDLVRDEFDDPGVAGLHLDPNILFHNRTYPDRPFGMFVMAALARNDAGATFCDELSMLEYHLDSKIVEVVDDDQIGIIPRQYCAFALQPEVPRWIDGGHLDRGHWVQTEADGFFNELVDASVLHISRLEVVRRETEKPGIGRGDGRQQSLHILGCRPFADENRH